jgi:uncharacterized protein (TIGR00369 family)
LSPIIRSRTGTLSTQRKDGTVVVPEDHLLAALKMRRVPTTNSDVAMELPVAANVVNDRGGLQGGLLATLADVVAGLAVLDGMPAGYSPATSDLSLHFLSAVTHGPALAEATVVRRGRRSAVVQVEVRDVGRDVLAAVCTVSFAFIELRSDQLR